MPNITTNHAITYTNPLPVSLFTNYSFQIKSPRLLELVKQRLFHVRKRVKCAKKLKKMKNEK